MIPPPLAAIIPPDPRTGERGTGEASPEVDVNNKSRPRFLVGLAGKEEFGESLARDAEEEEDMMDMPHCPAAAAAGTRGNGSKKSPSNAWPALAPLLFLLLLVLPAAAAMSPPPRFPPTRPLAFAHNA